VKKGWGAATFCNLRLTASAVSPDTPPAEAGHMPQSWEPESWLDLSKTICIAAGSGAHHRGFQGQSDISALV